ncbi:MAG TPA: hypothetical protein PK358_05070 [Spirochaetota bacterium]|nr:hypothetical protein [Spirochaetota bacterium]HPJ34185.1 hypothetical protein [Spirochaetota bacterium]
MVLIKRLYVRYYRNTILILSSFVFLFSCGNLINEEALNPSENPEEFLSSPAIEFKTSFNNNISTAASLHLYAESDEFAFTGSIVNDNNIENIWLGVLDKAGEKIFESIVSSDKDRRVTSQLTDADGDFIIVCNEIDPDTGDADILMFKISHDRTIQWCTRLNFDTPAYSYDSIMLTDRSVIIACRYYDPDNNTYIPLLIKFDPTVYTCTCYRLNYVITSSNDIIYPVPVKISSHVDDTITVAGYFIDPSTSRSCLSIAKFNSSMELTAEYNLIDSDKNLYILDIIHENKTKDIFLICKSDTLFGRDEGFTLLKVSNDNSIKFENDYMISDFIFADNLISGSEGDFSVGGYSLDSSNNYSITIVKFNYSGYMKEYRTLESDISEIRQIVFSKSETQSAFSYIYSCNRINDDIDGTIIVRQISDIAETKAVPGTALINVNKSTGTLSPVEFQNVDVNVESFNNFTVDTGYLLDVEWK